MKNLITAILLSIYIPLISATTRTRTITISAGELADSFHTEYGSITSLTIYGSIDARDFKTMRDSMTALTTVDISAATIVAYTGDSGTMIPNSSIVSYPENAIPAWAFRLCTRLTSIKIPTSVNSFGNNSFDHCSKLYSINIPSAVTYIGEKAFEACASLTSIELPSLLDSISYGTFTGAGITSITIPSSVTSIDDYAFFCCTELTTINIPLSVTTMGKYAFANCSDMSSIYVNWPTPPNINNTISLFQGIDHSSCILYVPEGSKSAYENTSLWNEFENIQENTLSSIDFDSIADSQLKVYPNPARDNLQLAGLETNHGLNYRILNFTGQIIQQGTVNAGLGTFH